MAQKYDIAAGMSSIMSSDTHRSIFARPTPGMTKTAAKKEDDGNKDNKGDAKTCAAECRKIMKEMECGGTAKASGDKCVIMCDDKAAIRKCKAKCKKMGVECEVKPMKKAMTQAAMNKYQACVYGLAKISETLDNAGFEKGATLALLALDSLVKDAQCSDDGEKEDKKDKKTTHKHETTKHTHEDDDDPECHVHENGKTKNLSEKEEKEIGKKNKGKKGKPPWLEDDDDDCGVAYPKGKTPDVDNATGGGPGPTRSEMQGIVNPWEESGAGAAKTRPDDDWKQYDPLRGFDDEFLEGLDADDGGEFSEPSERTKDTKKVLDRIRGVKGDKEKLSEPVDEEFSFVSLLDEPMDEPGETFTCPECNGNEIEPVFDSDGGYITSRCQKCGWEEDEDEGEGYIDFRSIAARRRQRGSLSKVAEELRKTRPFFAR